jgi:CHRD domain-containing protein
MHRRVAIVLCGLVALALAGLAISAGAGAAGRPFTTTLTGADERPGPGDPDGTGTASITLNQGKGEVCFHLVVSGIAPATAAHIHLAPPTDPGPIVVPLAPPTTGESSGCVSDVDPELIKAIRQDPDAYYVNVHNAEFPAGALRGQLSK